MSDNILDLIDKLVKTFPALDAILREHLADNCGEVLPHLFFADVTRYIVAQYTSRKHMRQLSKLLRELDHAFATGGEEVENVIAISFLENLPSVGEEGYPVRAMLGPSLKAELDRMGI